MRAKILKADNNFKPCIVDNGDELFRNGIFEFNITKMIKFIHEHPDEIVLEKRDVGDFYIGQASINEKHMDSVEVLAPVILAEISPGKYNLIDGNHRMEKARRNGTKNIMAYKISVNQHLRFLTNRKAYMAYIKYWNEKQREIKENTV
jgi:hypothetical protein